MSKIIIANELYVSKHPGFLYDYLLIDASYAYKDFTNPYISFTLPNLDCNSYVKQRLQNSSDSPIILGISYTDPYRRIDEFCKNLTSYNCVKGFTNFPSNSIFNGEFGTEINNSHIGVDNEFHSFYNSMIFQQFSLAFVYTIEQAELYASVGVTAIAISSLRPNFWDSTNYLMLNPDLIDNLKHKYPYLLLFNIEYNGTISSDYDNFNGTIYI